MHPGGIRDTRMQARAIRDRWPMSDAVRIKVLKRMCKIVDEEADHSPLPVPNHREVIAAARALLSADKLNLDQEKLDFAKQLKEKATEENTVPADFDRDVEKIYGTTCDNESST